MAEVDISAREPTPRIGETQLLFERRFWEGRSSSIPLAHHDVTSDGQGFAMIGLADGELQDSQLVVVLNWFEELKRRVPTRRAARE